MVRKSRSRRVQIITQVQKRKIRLNEKAGLMEKLEKILPTERLSFLSKVGRKGFEGYGKICSKLYLVPYSFTADGKLRIFSAWQLRIHYVVLSMLALSVMHKLAVLCYKISTTADSGSIDISTIISIVPVLISFVPLVPAASVLFRREETKCMLNTWDGIFESSRIDTGHGRVFSNIKATLVAITLVGLSLGAGLVAACLGFAFDTMPASYFTAAHSLGLIDISLMPAILWKFLFWPLELVTYMAPCLIGGWSGAIDQLVPVLMSDALAQLRKRKLDSWESNMALWKDYEKLAIFHSVAANYTGYFITPALFGCSAFVVVAFYVSIRNVGLPWWLYLLFLFTGVTTFLVIFWFTYQLVLVVRASEDVVEVLTTTPEKYFGVLPVPERNYMARKARATRALGYRMGNFGKFSLEVPIVMWEEIWNQLLFFLSL